MKALLIFVLKTIVTFYKPLIRAKSISLIYHLIISNLNAIFYLSSVLVCTKKAFVENRILTLL